MKDEAREWLTFAEENLTAARLLFRDSILNPTLQNAQQAAEKVLKALVLE